MVVWVLNGQEKFKILSIPSTFIFYPNYFKIWAESVRLSGYKNGNKKICHTLQSVIIWPNYFKIWTRNRNCPILWVKKWPKKECKQFVKPSRLDWLLPFFSQTRILRKLFATILCSNIHGAVIWSFSNCDNMMVSNYLLQHDNFKLW